MPQFGPLQVRRHSRRHGVSPALNRRRYDPAVGLAQGCGWKRIGPRAQISVAPPSPQCSNLRVGPQLALHIVAASAEDDASGAAGFELDEAFAQLLANACEGHLFRGGYVDERVVAV